MQNIGDIYSDYFSFLSLKVKPTTLLNVKRKFKNYILPFFKNYKIKDIKESDYINFLSILSKLNYSKSFYFQIHSCCKNLFSYLAMNYGVKNIPALVGVLNCGKNEIQTKNIWTNSEFKKFLSIIDDPIYYVLFEVLFYCGLRKGELFALKISDFSDKYLNVNKTLSKEFFGGKRIELTPKTKKSIRRIRIDRKLNNDIKKLIFYYSKKYNDFNNSFYLFGGKKPISPTTLERKKNYYCNKAGVKQIRIHDFRHSHATMLYNYNVDIKLIQERLGHSDISITLNTYIHTNLKQEKKLISLINFLRI